MELNVGSLKVKRCKRLHTTGAIENGAIPSRTPEKSEDENGFIEEAAIKLYDDAEIVFINRENYKGIFKPGYGKPIQKIET